MNNLQHTLEQYKSNYYTILSDDASDDDETIITSNTDTQHTGNNVHHQCTPPKDIHDQNENYGMLDSGTTDNFFAITAKVTNVRPTQNPINVVIPDGNKITSTHKCDINWPNMPKNAISGHIVPKLAQQSLLSVVKLCNAGCSVIFEHDCCIVMYNGKIVLYGTKCPKTGLWLVPLRMKEKCEGPTCTITTQQINNIHHTSNQSELIQYIHQCFFSPTKSTLIKAIKNDQLLGVPGLTVDAVNKHLPTSTATIKGHMHRERKNLRSTCKKQKHTHLKMICAQHKKQTHHVTYFVLQHLLTPMKIQFILISQENFQYALTKAINISSLPTYMMQMQF